MFSLCLVFLLAAPVFSESVRETETWMPMKTTLTIDMSTQDAVQEASGDSEGGSDFGFTDDEDYYNEPDDYDFSGSGDEETTEVPRASVKPGLSDNMIPKQEENVPTAVEEEDVIKDNEIPGARNKITRMDDNQSNVLMSHAGDDSIFHKTEVLAALIAGGAVGLLFAVLLILLLIYRMKKKDEGSYDLGKKPIYKKAPTTEIYA